MTPADLSRLSTLLDQALDLPVPDREDWLARLEGEAAAWAPKLRDLLARHALKETADLLERGPGFALPAVGPAPGDAVGPYRLLSELGSGGMGSVWLAERADGSLKRKVALKLPHISWAPGLAERFAREREILAGLEHPHIARLYDAGVDAQGRPFMAMEYVEGQPLDVYCRERALPIPDRLRLLLQVAEAVAYAHGRLVLHRDLKPANILVTAEGQVRLLDFGVAKLMQGHRAAETALTQASGRALTPDYASPEQIRGQAIGTASDVYSLGVVAFELLAGVRPYRLKRGSAAELEEAITGQDLPLASETAQTPAAARALRGDLDAILNKALKKLPAERYATVDALAQDWQRHVQGQRVFARPDTIGYRLMRFVRRHRVPLAAGTVAVLAFGLSVGVGATAVVILALLLGLGAALWQAREARAQAHVAQTEARTAAAVQDFLEGIFKASAGSQADPLQARQRTALQLLDEGAARIDNALQDAPQAKLRVLLTMATIFDDMGETERMAQLMGKRAELMERATPGAIADIAQAHAELAMALAVIGRDVEAAAHLARAEQALAALPDADDDAHLAVDSAIAQFHSARGEALGLQAAARLVQRMQSRPPSLEVANALMLAGILERHAGRPEEAVRLLNRAVEVTNALPAGGENTLHVKLTQLALAEADLGRPEAALEHAREALRKVEANAGPNAPSTIIALARLGQLLTEQGRAEEGLQPLLDARRRIEADASLAAKPAVVGPQRIHEGQAQRRLGQLGEAERCYRDALAATSSPDGSADGVLRSAAGLTLVLTEAGRLDEAQQALAQAQAARDRADLAGYGQALQLAQAGLALALAQRDTAAVAALWRCFADDERTAPHLQDPAVLGMQAQAALATAGAAEGVRVAEQALQTLDAGLPRPHASYERRRLRQVLEQGRQTLGRRSEPGA